METKWEGNVRDLVRAVAASDARETFVDATTGAKIRINIDGLEGATEHDEPLYIEYGDDLYDAYNRSEAIMILSNIREGKKYPDMPSEPERKKKVAKSKRKRRRHKTGVSVSSSRRT